MVEVGSEEEEVKRTPYDDMDKHDLLKLIESTDSMEEIIELTKLSDPVLR